MARMSFGARGKRWSALARLIAADNPNIQVTETADSITLEGPYITVTRQMVEQALFPSGAKHEKTIDKVLYGLALLREGRLVYQGPDRIVIGDDDGERAMSVRLRVDHQQDIARLADALGMSRNQFVVTAIEHFVHFLDESREMAMGDLAEEDVDSAYWHDRSP